MLCAQEVQFAPSSNQGCVCDRIARDCWLAENGAHAGVEREFQFSLLHHLQIDFSLCQEQAHKQQLSTSYQHWEHTVYMGT